ncbi:hypothetical protein ACEUZ9_000874 [Paracoccus litorisediminis]|uniref:hypothetical protein n=1 Tax=Paracoccus litorisediminis TaxID=2006130 RepID=UPI00372EDCDA
MSDLIRTRATRMDDARKIDEWTVKLPGGESAKFEVGLKYVDGTGFFSVKSEHPNFKDLRLVSDNFAALKEDVEIAAQAVIDNELSIDWDEARKIELRHQAREARAGECRFSLSINLDDVEYMPGAHIGNRGETRIRTQFRQSEIVQRGHDDDFSDIRPRSGLLTDPEVRAYMRSPLRGEDNEKVTRTILPGRGDEAPEMIATLDGFAALLAARLAPDQVGRNGLPSKDELVSLMRQAADAGPAEIPQGPSPMRL